MNKLVLIFLVIVFSNTAIAVGACNSQPGQESLSWSSGGCSGCRGWDLSVFAITEYENNNFNETIGIIVDVSNGSSSINFANVTVFIDPSTGKPASDASQDIRYGMQGEECTDPDEEEEEETDPGDGSGGGGGGGGGSPPPGDNGGGGGYFGPTEPIEDPCEKVKCTVIIIPAG